MRTRMRDTTIVLYSYFTCLGISKAPIALRSRELICLTLLFFRSRMAAANRDGGANLVALSLLAAVNLAPSVSDFALSFLSKLLCPSENRRRREPNARDELTVNKKIDHFGRARHAPELAGRRSSTYDLMYCALFPIGGSAAAPAVAILSFACTTDVDEWVQACQDRNDKRGVWYQEERSVNHHSLARHPTVGERAVRVVAEAGGTYTPSLFLSSLFQPDPFLQP